MSKQFHERLLRGSGLQTRPFHSKFGAALLKKFGWEEGQGLGKESNGRVECLQIRRREENVGLGHETASETKAQDQWRNWWDGLYNSMAAKLRTTAAQRRVLQSTLSSESDDDGEDCTVKPLYGKKSVLSAGQRTLKNFAHREANDTAMGNGSDAENVERDTELDIEQKSCGHKKKGTDSSAFEQKQTDSCFSFVDGAASTAAVTPRSHASSPMSSDPPVSASFAAQSFVSEDSISVFSEKEKKKKGSEIHTSNVARSVEDRTHSVQARTCTHESQRGKKMGKKRTKDALASADPEVEDESGIQTGCEAVKQKGCFLFNDNVERLVLKAQPRLKPNGGTDGAVQLFSDNLIEEGVGLPVADDSCSNERQKIRKESKRGRELAVTGEERRKVEGGVDAEEKEEDAARKKKKRKTETGMNPGEDEGDAGVKQERKKTKISNAEDGTCAFEKKRKKKRKHHTPDA